MLKAPKFWYKENESNFSKTLYPASLLYRFGTKLYNIFNKKIESDLPVICIGNLVVGGAGKTPVALKVGKILKELGFNPHFLSRGYAGKIKANIKIIDGHSADKVGDESLILAEVAPTWIGSNRIISCHLAKKNGADCVIMDDGFQNPTIKKDFSIIVIDGKQGFGNKKVLPSGPLRESIDSGLKRANVIMVVGKDNLNIKKLLPKSIPCFNAIFDVSKNKEIFKGKNVTAFAGIAYPTKFFDTLDQQGAKILKKINFPDHYIYNENDLLKLIEIANNNQSILVTTKKDYIRIPNNYRTIVHKLDGEIIIKEDELFNEILSNILEDLILSQKIKND